MGSPAVVLKKVGIRYGKFEAVNQVDLTINAGEILAVIGPNGSGKTSMIEMIEGLRKNTTGQITVLGSDPGKERRRIYQQTGIQLQEVDYPCRLKVIEICEWFNRLYGKQNQVNSLLELLGLQQQRKKYIKQLSGGQRQKLSILLALLGQPKLLILDELTTGMDPASRRSIWQVILEMKKKGVTIVLVSHFMDEVAYLADRIAYMERGRLLFCRKKEDFQDFVKCQKATVKIPEQASLEDLFLLINSAEKERSEDDGFL